MQERIREHAPVALALSAMLLGAGCEVAIPLIVAETVEESEPVPEPFLFEPVALEVVEASGFVVDQPVDGLELGVPEGFDRASGFFMVQVAGSPDVDTISVDSCSGDGFEDPYGGLPGGGGGGPRPTPEIDAGVPPSDPLSDPSFATPCGEPRFLVTACGAAECVNPEQAVIERVETAGGTEVRVDVSWAGGQPMTLRVREVR